MECYICGKYYELYETCDCREHDDLDTKTARPSLGVFAAAPGYALPAVGGRRIATSNGDFERKCLVMLGEEQTKLCPDNALIDLLCESVRIAREYSDAMNDGNPFTEADGWLGAEGHNAIELSDGEPATPAKTRTAFEPFTSANG